MKTIIISALLLFSIKLQAQITLEQTYDSASTWNYCTGRTSQLLFINFENSGEHYVKINYCSKNMKLYNLNHSIVKTISLSFLPDDGGPYHQMGNILYLSEKLFNTDNKIEFMYVLTSTGLTTFIYNEDGTMLFTEPGAGIVKTTVHQLQYPIYNTSQGTKMILSYTNGMAKVFSLAGTLSNTIQKTNENLYDASIYGISNPIPNPVTSTTQLNYILPKDVEEGEIVIFDIQGKEVKRYKVDNNFNNLIISTHDISAGTYYYQLQCAGQESGAKKMIVIK